jgi:hypothetical protein
MQRFASGCLVICEEGRSREGLVYIYIYIPHQLEIILVSQNRVELSIKVYMGSGKSETVWGISLFTRD